MDAGTIQSLYQQYLGRSPEEGAYSAWGGADYNTLLQGILGSQEYQNRNQAGAISAPNLPSRQNTLMPVNVDTGQQYQGQPTNMPVGNDINSIYQQYLGRGVDPSGAATYAGWNSQDIVNAILGSQEYKQRQASGGGGAGQAAPTGNAQDLANQVYGAYKTNANYDQALNQLNALPQNADYYRARLGLLGQMMGWQIGQNTGDRNVVYQRELESYLPGARAAGLTDAEINSLISQNSAQASQENQKRIAEEASKGQGWVNQNIPGGWGTVAGLAALAAVPYFAPEIFGTGAALETTGAGGLAGGGAFIPAAGSGASFAITPGAAYTVGQGLLTTEELLKGAVGGAFTPAAGSGASFTIAPGAYTAALAAGDGAWGLSPELAAELGLAGSASGLTDLSGEAGSAMLEQMGLNTSSGLSKFLGNIGSSLSGLGGSLGTLGLAGTALKALGGGTTPTTTAGAGATPSTYAPRGQVGYDPLLNLLAPKLIARNANSLLG